MNTVGVSVKCSMVGMCVCERVTECAVLSSYCEDWDGITKCGFFFWLRVGVGLIRAARGIS